MLTQLIQKKKFDSAFQVTKTFADKIIKMSQLSIPIEALVNAFSEEPYYIEVKLALFDKFMAILSYP